MEISDNPWLQCEMIIPTWQQKLQQMQHKAMRNNPTENIFEMNSKQFSILTVNFCIPSLNVVSLTPIRITAVIVLPIINTAANARL